MHLYKYCTSVVAAFVFYSERLILNLPSSPTNSLCFVKIHRGNLDKSGKMPITPPVYVRLHTTPLSSIPWIPPAHRPKSLNPILAHTLSGWVSIKYSARPLFPPGMENPCSFWWWRQCGQRSRSFQYLRDPWSGAFVESKTPIIVYCFWDQMSIFFVILLYIEQYWAPKPYVLWQMDKRLWFWSTARWLE